MLTLAQLQEDNRALSKKVAAQDKEIEGKDRRINDLEKCAQKLQSELAKSIAKLSKPKKSRHRNQTSIRSKPNTRDEACFNDEDEWFDDNNRGKSAIDAVLEETFDDDETVGDTSAIPNNDSTQSTAVLKEEQSCVNEPNGTEPLASAIQTTSLSPTASAFTFHLDNLFEQLPAHVPATVSAVSPLPPKPVALLQRKPLPIRTNRPARVAHPLFFSKPVIKRKRPASTSSDEDVVLFRGRRAFSIQGPAGLSIGPRAKKQMRDYVRRYDVTIKNVIGLEATALKRQAMTWNEVK